MIADNIRFFRLVDVDYCENESIYTEEEKLVLASHPTENNIQKTNEIYSSEFVFIALYILCHGKDIIYPIKR